MVTGAADHGADHDHDRDVGGREADLDDGGQQRDGDRDASRQRGGRRRQDRPLHLPALPRRIGRDELAVPHFGERNGGCDQFER
jgi:hypothetical protein